MGFRLFTSFALASFVAGFLFYALFVFLGWNTIGDAVRVIGWTGFIIINLAMLASALVLHCTFFGKLLRLG